MVLAAGLNSAHAHSGLNGQTVRARVSYYGEGDGFDGKRAADGSIFHKNYNTVAHKTLPFKTVVEFFNTETNRKAIGVVTDRGPFVEGRSFDLSAGLAEKLGFKEKGHTILEVRILSIPKKRHVRDRA